MANDVNAKVGFLTIVGKCDADTSMCIQFIITPKSIIMSNLCAAYDRIGELLGAYTQN